MDGWESEGSVLPYGEELCRASGLCGAIADKEGRRHVVSRTTNISGKKKKCSHYVCCLCIDLYLDKSGDSNRLTVLYKFTYHYKVHLLKFYTVINKGCVKHSLRLLLWLFIDHSTLNCCIAVFVFTLPAVDESLLLCVTLVESVAPQKCRQEVENINQSHLWWSHLLSLD